MEYKITSYCRIYNNKIWLNGKRSIFPKVDHGMYAEKLFNNLKMVYPKFYKMDILSQFGLVVSELVFQDYSLPIMDSMSVILSNRSSSEITDQRYWKLSKNRPSPGVFVYTLPNIVNGEICIKHKIKGETQFFVTSDFSARHLFNHVIFALNYSSSSCLAGWIEVQPENIDILFYLVSSDSDDKYPKHNISSLQNLYELWKF